MKRIQCRLFLSSSLLVVSFSLTKAQAPVSTYSDKCGNWKDNIIQYSQPPVTGFNEKLSCLKIYENRSYTRVDAAAHLKGDTALVVIDKPGSEYGKALKTAFSDYWKYTPYAFIDPFQVAGYAHKKGYAFFMLIRDESFEEVNTDQHGLVSANSAPHLHYKTDTLQHKAKTGFRMGIEGKTISSYIYMLALSSGMGGKDTSEETICNSLAVADYCIAANDKNSWADAEKGIAPSLNKIAGNFEKDIEYMNAKKTEKLGFMQAENYIMHCKGNDLAFSLNVIAFEGLKETWKNKTLFINNKLSNDLGCVIMARLLGLDESRVKMVAKAFIDSTTKAGSNADIMLWDTARDEAGDYMITSTEGTELIGLDVMAAKRICMYNKADQSGPYQTEKCDLLYNGKAYPFKFSFVSFGNTSKNILKNKTLLLNKEFVDELGRGIIVKMLGMDEGKVKLKPKAAIDSCIQAGDSNVVLLADATKDELHNYIITTTNRVELIGLRSKGNNKEAGDIEIIEGTKTEERKKYSLK